MAGCSWALLLLAVLPLAVAQPWTVCNSNTGNYSAGSVYEGNVLGLVDALRGNASGSASRFASGSLGVGADTVYGMILCRGDVTNSECFDCGTAAYEDRAAGKTCGRDRDVALCYNPCYVRLSDNNFLASTNNSGYIPLISGTSIQSSDVAGYSRVLTGLLNATVRYATDISKVLFATGQWVGPDPGFQQISAVAQCAGDLLPAQCRSCLQDLLDRWWTTLGFKPNGDGARVAASRCTLRYEVGAPFFNGAAMVQLPTKAATPGPAATPAPGTVTGDKKRNSTPILLIAVIVPVVLIILLVGMCILRKLYWKEKSRDNQDYAKFEEETPLHIDIRRFTYAELNLITKNFETIIGKGGFGIVYHGTLENGDEVAVKVLMETSIAESTDFLPDPW